MKTNKYLLGIRLQQSNRFTFPVILNQLESSGLDRKFQCHFIENFKDLRQFVKADPEGLLLYSFMTPHLPKIEIETKWIKKNAKNRKFKLVSGGPHTNGNPLSSLQLGFDYAFCGAAETGIVNFFQRYIEHKIPEVPTIFYSSDIENLNDSLPISRILPISPPLEITRGCYWKCQYCQISCMKCLHRSMESIKIYYQELYKRNHHQRVNFICPSAFEFGAKTAKMLNYHAVKELLAYCKSKGTSYLEYGIFPSETRPNTFSEEFVELVYDYCSNRKIAIGGQSGSDILLKKIRRGHTTGQIESACELVHQKKLNPLVDFIFGFPGETNYDRHITLKFIKKLSTKYGARIQLHHFIPLAGTILSELNPSTLDYKSLDTMLKYEKDGICTGWWKKGRMLAQKLVEIRDKLRDQEITYEKDFSLTLQHNIS